MCVRTAYKAKLSSLVLQLSPLVALLLVATEVRYS